MIVAKGDRNGQPLIMIGITESKIQELRKGNPILLRMERYPGIVASVAIFYGPTLGDLQADFMKAAGPELRKRFRGK